MKDIKYLIEKAGSDNPYTLIDVGSAFGIHGKWEQIEDSMNVIAFEPDQREFEKLENTKNRRFFPYIIHSKSEDIIFYVTKLGGHSSIYKPNKSVLSQFNDVDRYDTVEEENFPASRVRSLDELFEEKAIKDMDFIDLSTSGSELLVLHGSQKHVLPQTFGLVTKTYFLEKFTNQPLFRDVDQFMGDQGFQVIDLRRIFWKRKDFCDFTGKGQLERCDALYYKTIDGWAYDLKRIIDDSARRAKLFKSIITCIVYKSFDYAVSLAKMGLKNTFISNAEYEETVAVIKATAMKGSIPNFAGKNFLYKVNSKACELLKPPSYKGWADGDRFIGNVKEA